MGNAVMKIPTAGGTPITLASGQPGANYVAVDAASVYWTTAIGGKVMKLTPRVALTRCPENRLSWILGSNDFDSLSAGQKRQGVVNARVMQ